MDIEIISEKTKELRDLKGKPKSAFVFLKRHEHKARNPHERLFVAVGLGHLTLDIGKIKESQEYFQRALRINSLIRADILRKYAYLLNKLGKGQKEIWGILGAALKELQKAKRSDEWYFVAANVWATFGNIWFDHKEYQKAKVAYRRALQYARRTGHVERTATILGDIGNVYFAEKRFSKVIPVLERTLEIARKRYQHAEPSALLRLGRVYAAMGDLSRAERYFHESLRVSRRGGWKKDIADSSLALGVLLMQQGKHKKARIFLQRALALYHAFHFPRHIRHTEVLLRTIKTA